MLPGLASIPVIHFLLGTVLGVAVALLKFSFELVLLASDDIKIIVGQFLNRPGFAGGSNS